MFKYRFSTSANESTRWTFVESNKSSEKVLNVLKLLFEQKLTKIIQTYVEIGAQMTQQKFGNFSNICWRKLFEQMFDEQMFVTSANEEIFCATIVRRIVWIWKLNKCWIKQMLKDPANDLICVSTNVCKQMSSHLQPA